MDSTRFQTCDPLDVNEVRYHCANCPQFIGSSRILPGILEFVYRLLRRVDKVLAKVHN